MHLSIICAIFTQESKMGYRPMVEVNGNEWAGNALVFATEEEATANARNLMSRWMLVTNWRVDETSEPVNYRWTENGLKRVE